MKPLLYRFLQTSASWAAFVARLTLAVTFFPHGAQKALGWFGGYGFAGTMGFFTGQMHLPAILAALAIAAEFLGSLGLFVGLGTRLAALGLAVNMLVAIFLVHAPNGFFMNWTGQQKGEGVEYHLLVVGLALVLMIAGGGRLSLDRLLAARLEESGGSVPSGDVAPRSQFAH